jgi:hypothetical protein
MHEALVKYYQAQVGSKVPAMALRTLVACQDLTVKLRTAGARRGPCSSCRQGHAAR